MPQKKQVVIRSTSHVDSIREMIDIVRNQQVPPIAREKSASEISLHRRVPLPNITPIGGIHHKDPSPRDDDLWPGIRTPLDTEFTDTDPTSEYDELDPELMLRRRTPSPPSRNGAMLSPNSIHSPLGLSHSVDATTLKGHMRRVRHQRRGSQGNEPQKRRLVRTLPPVQMTTIERPNAPVPELYICSVPELDLSSVVQTTPDDLDLESRFSRPIPPSLNRTPSPS